MKTNTEFVPEVCVDAGNRAIKWAKSNGTTYCIPSFIKQIKSFESIPTKLDSQSILIQRGSTAHIIGKSARINGTPVYQASKTKLASLLVLTAIEPIKGSSVPLRVGKLKVCLPDTREAAAVADLQGLVGEQEFIRNGQSIKLIVDEVAIIEEGQGEFAYCQTHGMFDYPQRLNGVLSLGGGDVLGRLFDTEGNVLRDADIRLPGTYNLANAIASYLAVELGTSPDLSLIMDGIADNSFFYGMTGINFNAAYSECRLSWLTSIKAKIKEKWGAYASDLGQIVVTGGSAPLVSELYSGNPNARYKESPNPQFIGVLGMQLIKGE